MKSVLLLLFVLAAACGPGPGEFECGELFCKVSAEYCEQNVSDTGFIVKDPDHFVCRALPSQCAETPGCVCLAEATGRDRCEGSPETGLLIIVPGG